MDTIDIHFHTVAENFLDTVRSGALLPAMRIEADQLIFDLPPGVSVEAPPTLHAHLSDPSLILAAMDRRKLHRIVTSPPPQLFAYWASAELGSRIAAAMNDGVAAMHAGHPDRLFGLATVPLQDGECAARELDRAASELNFRGVAIGSNVNGIDLDHAQFLPFFEMAARRDLPVFIHPQNAGDLGRLQDYHLWNILGFPMETATAAARLIMSGLLERLPNLKIILAHGGGFLPYQLGRLDHGWKVRPELNRRLPRPPSAYLGHIYCDSIIHHDRSRQFLIDRFGADHVVLGTDYPFDMGSETPVDEILALGLSDGDTQAILGGNLARLLKLPPITAPGSAEPGH